MPGGAETKRWAVAPGLVSCTFVDLAPRPSQLLTPFLGRSGRFPLLMPHVLGLHPLLTAVRILCLAIFLAGQRIVSVLAHLLTIHQGQVRLPVTPEPPFTPNWAGHLPAESSFRFSRHLNFAE